MNKDNSGAAFPVHAVGHVEESRGSASPNLTFTLTDGLTKRQWFAGMALAGYNSGNPSAVVKDKVRWAREDADALLAALEAHT